MKSSSSKFILTALGVCASLTLVACGGGSKSASVDSSSSTAGSTVKVSDKGAGNNVSPAKMGANGQYDEHGLAKRVKKAVDNIPNISNSARVYVAQKGSTVYLKGNVANRSTLETVVSVVKSVKGVEAVNTDGITLK
ncbi:MAG: BON domain-containing protein [Xenococcaceae cyanobacterium MO_188.B19]|nr:BON domain-containing protein [Xenococcaceae cyanobacterium MO_188.B19]